MIKVKEILHEKKKVFYDQRKYTWKCIQDRKIAPNKAESWYKWYTTKHNGMKVYGQGVWSDVVFWSLRKLSKSLLKLANWNISVLVVYWQSLQC